MTLAAGIRLGPYEIVAPLGAGGMGEVYKARDTRLDRTVAIKVLPSHLSADPERRARFEREAKTVAGLTHPHICTLFDVGQHGGSTFLVMEHLEGETLAHRLETGALPLEQALTIATEVADALTMAHRQGVIHRDLKPGNVMLTKAGAKLLDFGLAKLTGHGEQPAGPHLASAVTQSTPLTGEGRIVGTLQYMAPEQLEGKSPDARTDLWALGVMLYEMLTGKPPFDGTSSVSLIGNIMNAEAPALATRQPLAPPPLERLVKRCLAKDPDHRWESAHDFADELKWIAQTSGPRAPASDASATPTVAQGWLRRGAWALVAAALLTGAAAGAMLMWRLRPASPPVSAGVIRSLVDVRPAEELHSGGVPTPGGTRTAFVWTPDGRTLVFIGRQGGLQQIYVRRLDAGEARPLAGTSGAQVLAVSADSQWLAFWAPTAVKKVPLAGGPVMDWVPDVVAAPHRLAWDGRGGLYFDGGSAGGAIRHVEAAGAKTSVTTMGEFEQAHILPSVLPGDRGIVYTVRKRYWTWGGEEVVAQELPGGKRHVILNDAADVRYLPTGHLVFVRRGVLFAASFDAARFQVDAAPVPVMEGVAQSLAALSGAGQFDVAASGSLAWVPGPVDSLPGSVLVTVDRQGRISPLAAPVRTYRRELRVSPNGRQLAVPIRTLTEIGLWLYDLDRGVLTPLTRHDEATWPLWSPDGQHIVFNWLHDGRYGLARQSADGSTPAETLSSGWFFRASSWTRPGQVVGVLGESDLGVATLEDSKSTLEPLLQTPDFECCPDMSPDGRWLAYQSNSSGRPEIYVQSHPGPGARTQVSLEGGFGPAWHRNGREVYFVSPLTADGRRRMMAVAFAPGVPPRPGRPQVLFEFNPQQLSMLSLNVRCYDVSPDGQRFYAVQLQTPSPPPPVTQINLVQNWTEELKAKIPVK